MVYLRGATKIMAHLMLEKFLRAHHCLEIPERLNQIRQAIPATFDRALGARHSTNGRVVRLPNASGPKPTISNRKPRGKKHHAAVRSLA